jgi:DNA-directed RNA polymerase specialized sigma24 family protein
MEELAVAALQELPFNHREVLVLNIYCGYSFEEIATMLGKSPEAIWTRASRARSQLRKLIHERRGKQKGSGSVGPGTGEDR